MLKRNLLEGCGNRCMDCRVKPGNDAPGRVALRHGAARLASMLRCYGAGSFKSRTAFRNAMSSRTGSGSGVRSKNSPASAARSNG